MSLPVFHKASSHSQITREQTWKLQEVHVLSSTHSWKPTLIETHHGFPIENSPPPHLPCFIYWKYRIESFSPLYGSPQWVTEDSVWKPTKDVYHSSMEPTLTLPCWSQTLQRPCSHQHIIRFKESQSAGRCDGWRGRMLAKAQSKESRECFGAISI